MSSQLADFLRAIAIDPASASNTWLVLADWLEDQGDPRFELMRLQHDREYSSRLTPTGRDARIRELLAEGIGPLVPTMTNSIGMTFVLVPAGTFLMGSPDNEGHDWEHPQHEVEITRPFWMGAFPVLQGESQHVMGMNPSYFCASGAGKEKLKGVDTMRFPVEWVSWEDANQFCEKMTKLPTEKKEGRVYRLPTEAQWEYACRGGATSYSTYYFGSTLSPKQTNFIETALYRPSPVGSYPANSFGLHDMHGNVWEWCLDVFDATYYQKSPIKDPQCANSGACLVLRGGSWMDAAAECRSAHRSRYIPGGRNYHIGFRVCFLLD